MSSSKIGIETPLNFQTCYGLLPKLVECIYQKQIYITCRGHIHMVPFYLSCSLDLKFYSSSPFSPRLCSSPILPSHPLLSILTHQMASITTFTILMGHRGGSRRSSAGLMRRDLFLSFFESFRIISQKEEWTKL